MLWARLKLILAQVVRQGLKWALRKTQNTFAYKNKLYYCYHHFWVHRENKNWKNNKKTVWRIFSFHQRCYGFSILIGCFLRTITLFSLFIGLFQRAKCSLARQMRHNARQSDNKNFYPAFKSLPSAVSIGYRCFAFMFKRSTLSHQ